MTTTRTPAPTAALSPAELDALTVDPLPDRAAMSLVNANVAAPINAALALNVLSDNSTATATATQTAPIVQSVYSPPRHPQTTGEIAMTTARPPAPTAAMSPAELDALTVEPLPDRAAMSLDNANVAAPINAALALNVLSDNSTATATATQTAPIMQGI